MKALKITASFTDRDSVALTKYLNDISKYQPVSAEKEAELAKKIKDGDEKALTELVCANLRFVVSVAKQYQNRGVALIDLINQGNMGLMKAAKRFDETRGFKFISFAVWWVRQSIIELINENGKIVRIPVNKTNLANKYVKTFADLEQKLERTPTDEEVLDAMGIDDTFDEDGESTSKSKSKVSIASLLNRAYSIDTKIADDEDTKFSDMLTTDDIPKPDHFVNNESMKTDISSVLSSLSERERDIIKMFYGLGCREMSLAEIGEKLDYSSERIRQIREGALNKLRERKSTKKLVTYL